MMNKILVVGFCAAGLTAGAWAHSGAMGVVEERMDAMKAMGDAVKRIKPIMSGEAGYDVATVQAASEVLPTVWSDRTRFEALAQDLEVAARDLERAAENGTGAAGQMPVELSAMMGATSRMMGGEQADGAISVEPIAQMPADDAFVTMTQVCSACHDHFREEK